MSVIEKQSGKYDVSVVVLTYNASYDKLLDTVKSALSQEGVSLEIVIADDGSSFKAFDELREYFKSAGFNDYCFVENADNQGTVKNFYSGLLKCQGEYVKPISPGDMLYGKDTLKKWISFMKENGLKWSFSEYICYNLSNKEIVPISAKAYPRNLDIFKAGSFDDQRWQYLALEDICVGACMIGEREIVKSYCSEIIDKVKYAEDNIWRIMMFDGVPGSLYPKHAILYEYGGGISTTSDDKWGPLLEKDLAMANEVIYSRNDCDRFQNKLKWAIKTISGDSKLKKLFIKGFISQKLLKERKTVNYLPEDE